MTVEEDLLSRWLHDQTPEPPRTLTLADIARAGSPHPAHHAARRWAPILAAAAVIVLLAVALAAVAGRKTHHPTPPAHSTASPLPAPTGKAIGPWHATPIPGRTRDMLFLNATQDSLYVENAGPIQRIDPVTGRVLASIPEASWDIGAVVVADNLLWVVDQHNGAGRRFDVVAYDPKTLDVVARVPVTFSLAGGGVDARLTASADGTRLAVAFYGDVAVIDPAKRRVVHQLALTRDVHALDLSPDGSRLYLGEQPHVSAQAAPIDTGSVLHVVDPLTGRDLAAPVAVPHSFSALTATGGGVWVLVTTVGGTHSALYWVPTGAAAPGRPVAGATHGLAARVIGGVVWLNESGALSCADPTTGAVRASVHADLAIDGTTGGRWFGRLAIDGGRDSRIVDITPPRACTG